MVTDPSTIWAWHRITSLIVETKALPSSQTTHGDDTATTITTILLQLLPMLPVSASELPFPEFPRLCQIG